MKVYAVVYSHYDESFVEGIFSTRGKADLYLSTKDAPSEYYIEGFTIDEKLKPMYAFEVKITEKTRKVEYCRLAKKRYGFFMGSSNVGQFYYDRTAGRLPSFVICVNASDKEKAEHLAAAMLESILSGDRYPTMRNVLYTDAKDADINYDRAFGPLLVFDTGEDVSDLLLTRVYNGWYELTSEREADPWDEILGK